MSDICSISIGTRSNRRRSEVAVRVRAGLKAGGFMVQNHNRSVLVAR